METQYLPLTIDRVIKWQHGQRSTINVERKHVRGYMNDYVQANPDAKGRSGIVLNFHAIITHRCHATIDLLRAKNHPTPCAATHSAIGQKKHHPIANKQSVQNPRLLFARDNGREQRRPFALPVACTIRSMRCKIQRRHANRETRHRVSKPKVPNCRCGPSHVQTVFTIIALALLASKKKRHIVCFATLQFGITDYLFESLFGITRFHVTNKKIHKANRHALQQRTCFILPLDDDPFVSNTLYTAWKM